MENVNETSWKFPLAGEDTSQAFMDQPVRPILAGQDYARTTIQAVNVRGIDPIVGLLRGGSRTGFSKYIPTQPNGSGLIQDLDTIVWTDPSAVGSGGGYQPQQPADPAAESYTLKVGYVFTACGMQIVVRMLQSTPLARTSTVTNSLNILGPVSSPLSDFPNASQGFSVRVSTVDQNGDPVALSQGTQVLQPLRMNSTGSLTYLGLATTQLCWANTYPADPGSGTFTTTVELLDAAGNPVPNLDGSGVPSGGNVEQSFMTGSMTPNHFLPFMLYLSNPYSIVQFVQSGYVGFCDFQVIKAAGETLPTLLKPMAGFWAYGTPPSGPSMYPVGRFGLANSSAAAYTGGSLDTDLGNGLYDGVRVLTGIFLTPGITEARLTVPDPSNSFDFRIGIYGGYFVSTTDQAAFYQAVADFANSL